jgi:hypothetical protein
MTGLAGGAGPATRSASGAQTTLPASASSSPAARSARQRRGSGLHRAHHCATDRPTERGACSPMGCPLLEADTRRAAALGAAGGRAGRTCGTALTGVDGSRDRGS